MKKRAMSLLLSILLISNLLMSLSYANDQNSITSKEELRAVWVATVVNLDYPIKGTTDAEVLKKEALAILNRTKALGLNSVILQVRPTADAFYKSSLFPWSKYLTGKQGVEPSANFDPLKFWVDEAHARGLELHAWINPYRITRKLAAEPAHDFASLSPNNPAVLNPSWVIKHTDGNLYFDPGNPEALNYIVKGVEELVKNYDVDGIHFDDYFYPSTTFDDAKSFALYGKGYKSIHDWRRDNVNKLINQTYTAIKIINDKVSFGISPFGIWANKSNNALGSDTNGLESYYAHYADTRKWVLENRIDYIAPQIYWNIGHSKANYAKLVRWWSELAKKSNVSLYIGHAVYNTGNTDKSSPWFGVDEIKRQLDLNKTIPEIDGSIFFRYGNFAASAPLSNLIKSYYDTGVSTFHALNVARPIADITTTATEYYLGGASDARFPLFLNGTEVKDRTATGFFGVFVPLKAGVNQFVFEQNGIKFIRTITSGKPPVVLALPMTTVEIIPSTIMPRSNLILMPGEVISFSCLAPIGATVKVKVADKEIVLSPRTTVTTSPKPYATTFSGQYQIPNTITAPILKWGQPVYTMVYKGMTYSVNAPGAIQIVTENSPLIAAVSVPYADTFLSSSAVEGAHYIINKGMTDRVTGKIGEFVKLSSGIWIKEENIKISEKQLNKNAISMVKHEVLDKKEQIHLIMNERPVLAIDNNGKSITIKLSNTAVLPPITLNSSKLFSSVVVNPNGSYTLALKNDALLAGYAVENTDVGYRVDFKQKFLSSNVDKPLLGSIIMLDPGHGGTDTGALGLLGTLYPEKRINIEIANKLKIELESMGAKVLMTRSEDETVTLQERLLISRKSGADLLVSIHADSAGDTLNLSKVNGFTVFYKDLIAKSVADRIRYFTATDLLRRDRGIKTANFYIIRGTWSPSILIESGFVPNPAEFEWLIDPVSQTTLSKKWAEAIRDYFK